MYQVSVYRTGRVRIPQQENITPTTAPDTRFPSEKVEGSGARTHFVIITTGRDEHSLLYTQKNFHRKKTTISKLTGGTFLGLYPIAVLFTLF